MTGVVVYKDHEVDIALQENDLVVKKGLKSRFDSNRYCHVIVKDKDTAQEISQKPQFEKIPHSKSQNGITLLADNLGVWDVISLLQELFPSLRVV